MTSVLRKRSREAWSALRHRDFRLLWFVTFVSNAGSWMQQVATSWVIYEMTGSKAWLGVDAFASGFTTVVLLPSRGCTCSTPGTSSRSPR